MEDPTRLVDEVQHKTCTKCGISHPATTEFFFRQKAGKYGVTSRCKGCCAKDKKSYKNRNRDKARAAAKAYVEANREKLRQQSRDRYWSDPEKAREKARKKNKKRYEKNPEKNKAQSRAWQKANSEKMKIYRKEYGIKNAEKKYSYNLQERLKNPEKAKKSRRESARRRRAKKVQNGFKFYTEQQVLDSYGTDCHLCGTPVDLEAPRSCGMKGWKQGLHIDHVIPISKGGPDTLENVRPAHGLCNIRKSDSLVLDSLGADYGKVEFPS